MITEKAIKSRVRGYHKVEFCEAWNQAYQKVMDMNKEEEK